MCKISSKDYYERYHSLALNEDNLIQSRLILFITANAFIFAGYMSILCKEAFDGINMILISIIPFYCIILSWNYYYNQILPGEISLREYWHQIELIENEENLKYKTQIIRKSIFNIFKSIKHNYPYVYYMRIVGIIWFIVGIIVANMLLTKFTIIEYSINKINIPVSIIGIKMGVISFTLLICSLIYIVHTYNIIKLNDNYITIKHIFSFILLIIIPLTEIAMLKYINTKIISTIIVSIVLISCSLLVEFMYELFLDFRSGRVIKFFNESEQINEKDRKSENLKSILLNDNHKKSILHEAKINKLPFAIVGTFLIIFILHINSLSNEIYVQKYKNIPNLTSSSEKVSKVTLLDVSLINELLINDEFRNNWSYEIQVNNTKLNIGQTLTINDNDFQVEVKIISNNNNTEADIINIYPTNETDTFFIIIPENIITYTDKEAVLKINLKFE